MVEGISGSGKTTLVEHITQATGARALHVLPPPYPELTHHINTHARALPQLAFYLSGLLHAADIIRDGLRTGPVIADRYTHSIIANHAAVHRIDHHTVLDTLAPYLPYLPHPTTTIYLHTGEHELLRRMPGKTDLGPSDRRLVEDRALLRRITDLYDVLAADDPTAVHVTTDGSNPEELAAHVLDLLEARRAS
ncbi:thymidylate kinase [Streptomyces sp. SID3343]|uniref:thymidylate kinase n=1 Tax=Streptomyces sp. SID3343 TaxID=2690260 RepID=UPI001367F8CC|nr:thymidylate kinase [Streptomyces sp. SID3343]